MKEITETAKKATEMANKSLKNDFGGRLPNRSLDRVTRERSRVEGTKEWAVCAAIGISTDPSSNDKFCLKIIEAIENN